MRIWEEFTIEQHIEYINAELLKGRSMADIEQLDYGVSPRVITKKLDRRGYKRAKDGNKLFTLVDGTIQPTTLNKPIKKAMTQKEHNSNIKLSSDNAKALMELLEMVEPLKELLKAKELQENIIEVPELEIIPIQNVKPRMSKADANTWIQFEKVCKKYKQYSVQDLLNTALLEFINKYK